MLRIKSGAGLILLPNDASGCDGGGGSGLMAGVKPGLTKIELL
jgi:hypothetical protein